MKNALFLLLFVGYFNSYSQSGYSKKWVDNKLSYLTIIEENSSFDTSGHDLSEALMHNNNKNTIGFIGNNFQRLKIKFTSVKWNFNKQSLFIVKGKSQVNNSKNDFTGTIEVIRFLHIKVEEHESNSDLVVAKYNFSENKNQKNAGLFSGYLLLFLKCSDGGCDYDNELEGADGFSNNQYIGTWTSYTTKAVKKCNFGDYRIPDSGDLDVGAGEFIPNVKYLKFGWQNYYNAYAKDNKATLIDENKKWWLSK